MFEFDIRPYWLPQIANSGSHTYTNTQNSNLTATGPDSGHASSSLSSSAPASSSPASSSSLPLSSQPRPLGTASGRALRSTPYPCTASDTPELMGPRVPSSSSSVPFRGVYSGGLWNAQGLFASKSSVQHRKWDKVWKLSEGRDFIMVTETHSNAGKVKAKSDIITSLNFRAWWSHGTNRRAGVGILVRNSFLQQFSSKPPQWIHIQKGEAAVLRLSGPSGDLDLFVSYFPTGNQRNEDSSLSDLRFSLRAKLAEMVRPPSQALSLIAGDFNYVVSPEDRWTKSSAANSRVDDRSEQSHWESLLEGNLGLHELFQPMATHDNSASRSRIDRVYSNGHVVDQLDFQQGIAALEWCPKLSNHRPVIFFKRKSVQKPHRSGPIPLGPIKQANWAHRVRSDYGSRLEAFGPDSSAFDRLRLLKESMREVSWSMQEDMVRCKVASEAEEVDDRLGWTMRLLRAIEGGREGVKVRCLQAYPALSSYISAQGDLEPLRQHAIALHRASILEELKGIQADSLGNNDHATASRRSRVQARLKQLKPGHCGAIGAIMGSDGCLRTTPSSIAAELQRHWGDVFSSRPSDHGILQKWIAEEFNDERPLGQLHHDLGIQASDIDRNVDKAPNSMPGPDGIPYIAWKRLGATGKQVLLEAAQDLHLEDTGPLLDEDGSEDLLSISAYNLGTLVFLPKKIAGVDPLWGDYYFASDVRPLCIVNTDNRIIANSVRHKLEPVLNRWVSSCQRGFLSGRSMLANVVDVEHAAQVVALSEDQGAIILLDFKAAFPSIGHDFLHRMLEAIGLPSPTRAFIRNLYRGHRCHISFGGESHPGFNIGSGIRQGCPISPLVFAAVIDIVLRRIQRLIPNAAVRAFADDIGLVVPNLAEALPILEDIFEDLVAVAGLALNLPKCVVIPLWQVDYEILARDLHQRFPYWASVAIQGYGKYLGFFVGPSAEERTWAAPLRKYQDTARLWGKLGLGLHMSTIAYSIYVLPILSFVAQLSVPPPEAFDVEGKALRAIIPGPFQWILPQDLFRLGDLYGQGASFPSLKELALSAQKRVSIFENRSYGGLRLEDKHKEIRRCIQENPLGRFVVWQNWFNNGPVQVLRKAGECLVDMGFSTNTLIDMAGGPIREGEEPMVRHRRIRKSFQRTVRRAIAAQVFVDPVGRMRHKLDRFGLPGWPGLTATRCLHALKVLHRDAPPRVGAAVLRTMFNGWTTARRFQRSGPCLFRCNCFWHEDSIEHYAACPVTNEFGRRMLKLKASPASTPLSNLVVFGMNMASVDDLTILRRGIWVYAIYKTFCILSQAQADSSQEVLDTMGQCARDGVKGHATATWALDNVYATGSLGEHRQETLQDIQRGPADTDQLGNSAEECIDL